MNTFVEVAAESTCLKRVTVCELYDANGRLLARNSNRCSPRGGKCSRIGITDGRADYPSQSSCNWMHAEMRALNAIRGFTDLLPELAIVFGHDFPCPDCEGALRKAGVKRIAICPDADGCGVRR